MTTPSWRTRIRAYITDLPPSEYTPARDLALLEASGMGKAPDTYPERQRLLVLLRAARNDAGDVTIDGQRALLDALRDRARQPMAPGADPPSR